jgi:hypothetical protein
MADGGRLPKSFDAWLQRAVAIERQIVASGVPAVRIVLFLKNLSAVRCAALECELSRESRPKAFPSWVGIVTRLTSNEPYEGSSCGLCHSIPQHPAPKFIIRKRYRRAMSAACNLIS